MAKTTRRRNRPALTYSPTGRIVDDYAVIEQRILTALAPLAVHDTVTGCIVDLSAIRPRGDPLVKKRTRPLKRAHPNELTEAEINARSRNSKIREWRRYYQLTIYMYQSSNLRSWEVRQMLGSIDRVLVRMGAEPESKRVLARHRKVYDDPSATIDWLPVEFLDNGDGPKEAS